KLAVCGDDVKTAARRESILSDSRHDSQPDSGNESGDDSRNESRDDARNAAYGLYAFNVSICMGDVALFENARILGGKHKANEHLIPHNTLERCIGARVWRDSNILSLFRIESRFDNRLEK